MKRIILAIILCLLTTSAYCVDLKFLALMKHPVAGGSYTWINSGDGTYESTQTQDSTSAAYGGLVVLAGGHTLLQLDVNITSVGTATQGKIALYDEYGNNRLADGGTFTPTTGHNAKTISYVASAGTYLVAIMFNTTDAVVGVDTGSNGRYVTAANYASFPELNPGDHGTMTNLNMQVRVGY